MEIKERREEKDLSVYVVSEWLKEKRKCEAYAGIMFGQKFQIPDNFDGFQRC